MKTTLRRLAQASGLILTAILLSACQPYSPPKVVRLIEAEGEVLAVVLMNEYAGDEFETYSTSDGGLTWTQTESVQEPATTYNGDERDDIHCVDASSGHCYRSRDRWEVGTSRNGGATWSTSGPHDSYPDLSQDAYVDLEWVTCSGGRCHRELADGEEGYEFSSNYGQDWRKIQTGPPVDSRDARPRTSCSIKDTNDCVRYRSAGQASYESEDGGITWEPGSVRPSGTTVHMELHQTVCATSDRCYRIINRTHLEESFDGGKNWSQSW